MKQNRKNKPIFIGIIFVILLAIVIGINQVQINSLNQKHNSELLNQSKEYSSKLVSQAKEYDSKLVSQSKDYNSKISKYKKEITSIENKNKTLEENNSKLEKEIDNLKKQTTTTTTTTKPTNTALYSASKFRSAGIVYYNNYRWTWYSEKVLPGNGLNIPNRHVDGSGYVCDENNYICLAASSLSKGTVVDTPFGKKGKVYDDGCAAGTLDVYVSW